MPTFLFIAALVLLLAWANGANDVAKGVATLAGGGVAGARRAVSWGAGCTLLGGLAALVWGGALLDTFSGGLLVPGFRISQAFVACALFAAVAWVAVATRLGLPVSTTHALLGGTVGAALAAAGWGGLQYADVLGKALLPLLVSPLIAIALCAGALALGRILARRLPSWRPGCCAPEEWQRNPFVCATASQRPPRWQERAWIALHWLSSGVTSFARGLNDTPKIAAFLVLAAGLAPEFRLGGAWAIVAVTLIMGIGSVWGGYRVLEVLARRVTPLDHGTGLTANAGTSLLVLAATPLGLPVSTTHVSTGALFGIRLAAKQRPEADALGMILFGWVVTLPLTAVVAAAGMLLAGG
jgi:PiT family inorganic phosphate transporter